MILGYLNSTSDAAGADPALVQKTQSVLDRGYKLLTGYETSDKATSGSATARGTRR